MWILYAFLAAFFAALTAILSRLGLEGVNSNLATAIRTVVVLFMAWAIVMATGVWREIPNVATRSWIFLGLSGIATGASWLFFMAALQRGDVSRVVPIDKFSVVITMVLAFIILGDTITAKTIIGGLLITAGTLVLVF